MSQSVHKLLLIRNALASAKVMQKQAAGKGSHLLKRTRLFKKVVAPGVVVEQVVRG